MVADVCQEDGESGVDKLPNHEHGFAMFETKDTKQAEEKALFCSLHDPLVAGGILPLFHPFLSPHFHLKTNGAVLSIVQPWSLTYMYRCMQEELPQKMTVMSETESDNSLL